MSNEFINSLGEHAAPLFVLEFADMTGEGWGRTAAVLCQYFLEMRKLAGLIGVDNSGTRLSALDEFDAGMGDLKPGEILYSLTHAYNLNERLPREAAFLTGEELQRVEDLLDLPNSTQLTLLDVKRASSLPMFPLQIRETARSCIRRLREQERLLQANSIRYLSQDLDPRISTLAELAGNEPRQTVAAPGRRLILTMTESDLTAVFSLGQDCGSVYDLKGRVIAREGAHRIQHRRYSGLASLLDPLKKNEPVVVARLLYFAEGKAEYFRNPWEIDPNDYLLYSKRLHELIRSIADGVQFGMRDYGLLSMLENGTGSVAGGSHKASPHSEDR